MKPWLLIPLVAACTGDDGTGTATIDVSALTYSPCAAAERVGGFEVVLTTEFTGVQGQVFDSVLPSSVPTTIATVGECRLVAAPNHQCQPTCGTSEVCSANQTCVAYPAAHPVGTVAVAGLASPIEMTPRLPTYYYTNTASLPEPAYEPSAGLRVSAAGGDYAAFSLLGWGIERLVLGSTSISVVRDTALPLTWTAPAEEGPAKVIISLNINGHGLVGSHVECTVADTGAYTLPASLITQLVDSGTSGFPTITVTRATVDSTAIEPGCVDFRVHSAIKLDVTIPGLVSCDDDDDCTAPQTCQGDLTCG